MAETQKHTPGPWDIHLDGRAAVITRKRHNTDRQEICTVYNAGVALREGYDNEFAANAHLIAAAPDLLAAAIGVTDCTDKDGGVFIPANGATMQSLRAAIAKATGA